MTDFKKWFAARARNPDKITLEEAFNAGVSAQQRAQPAPTIAEQDQINAEAAIRSIYGAQAESCPCCGEAMRIYSRCRNADCEAVMVTPEQAKYNKVRAFMKTCATRLDEPPAPSAPSEEAAAEMGANGGHVVEAERLAFEAWMRGHCWKLGAKWTGTEYRSAFEKGGMVDMHAMRTRELWAAWRDRAALAAPKPEAKT